MSESLNDLLTRLDACTDAKEWASTQPDIETAWKNCRRSDWMLWLLDATNYQDPKNYRLIACACVRETPLADGRKVWDLLTDQRSRNAVEVAERFAIGEATEQARAAAGAAAWDAAGAAAWDAAGDAAGAAAWDAAWASAWATAWDAAGDAAGAAAGAAAWAAAREWQKNRLLFAGQPQPVAHKSAEQKLAAALAVLGRKWCLHPASTLNYRRES